MKINERHLDKSKISYIINLHETILGGSMPLKIVSDNIFNLDVEAMVNPVHQHFFSYSNMRYDVMNHQMDAFKNGIKLTENILTKSHPHMKSSFIIHTVGPRYYPNQHESNMSLLKQTYLNCLQKAVDHHIQSIAFPLISTGGKRFPKSYGIEAANDAIQTFLKTHDLDVYLVIYHDDDFNKQAIRNKKLESYIGRNYRPEEVSDHIQKDTLRVETFEYASKMIANQGYDFETEKTFQELLITFMNKKHIDPVILYKKAEISKQHFSKMINQEGYQPKRRTVLLLCLAMELNYDESLDLLESLGYTFSTSNIEDVIVKYFIQQKHYDLYDIDEVFLTYTSETLRNYD